MKLKDQISKIKKRSKLKTSADVTRGLSIFCFELLLSFELWALSFRNLRV